MTVKVIVDSQIQDSLLGPDDGTQPGAAVIWPAPRSPKIDFWAVLNSMLNTVWNLDIPIVTNGAFHSSMLRDAEFLGRSVIVIQRSSDMASRDGVGELQGVFSQADVASGELLDVDGVLQDPAILVLKDQVSEGTVDIWLFDENDQRIEQLYLLVKTVMFAATKTFTETLGYTELIRVNGQDSVTLNTEGGNFFIFERSLQYRFRHFDFIAGIEQVVNLIREQGTDTDSSKVPTSAVETENL